jgi:hypothetical protein
MAGEKIIIPIRLHDYAPDPHGTCMAVKIGGHFLGVAKNIAHMVMLKVPAPSLTSDFFDGLNYINEVVITHGLKGKAVLNMSCYRKCLYPSISESGLT